jgi:hypothetical protein
MERNTLKKEKLVKKLFTKYNLEVINLILMNRRNGFDAKLIFAWKISFGKKVELCQRDV